MAFPQRSNKFWHWGNPIGWESRGMTGYSDGSWRRKVLFCSFCHGILWVGKENNQCFLYCLRCEMKIKRSETKGVVNLEMCSIDCLDD